MAKHNKTGKLGEEIASKFLINKGHTILEKNYWKKYGEIDIISVYNNTTYFTEVKSTIRDLNQINNNNSWLPEEMVSDNKVKRLRRVVSVYLDEHNINNWSFNIVIVYINNPNKSAKCKLISDIIL